MTAEIGHFALILALPLTLVFGVLSLVGAWRRDARLMAVAAPAATGAFALVVLAFACLIALFVGNEFTVQLVAQHSNRNLPLAYRVAASWGSHEGSMLLWVLMLAGWTAAVALLSGQLPATLRARVLGTMGLIGFGFLLFLLFTSNPFERLVPAAAEGRDLNPLLQDPGMVFHPPLLYMGYVGFAVAFAFAIAGLLEGRFDAAWARWARPWTTVAWSFLTLGICLGSFWAYYELGWGGWWFWDPVENASFLPWLVGTALIHSLAVTEKRGSFKNWTVLLAIGAFSLSLLGTFLVRSGVLSSVHAFASDPKRGIFILIFLAVVVGSSLTLFAWRAPKVSLGGAFALMSRETLLLINNVLLLSAAGAVLLGTLYPLVIDALNLGKLSVGPPYFNAVFTPLMVPLLFLMAVGPVARWKHTSLAEIARPLRWAFGIAVAAGVSIPFFYGGWSGSVALGMGLAIWIVGASVLQILARTRSGLPPRAFWGMHLAHMGVAVTVVGIVMVTQYESERDVRMAPGDTVKTGDYQIRFLGVEGISGPNYNAAKGNLELLKDGQLVMPLHPEKRKYLSSAMPMTEAFIDPGLTRDIYVSLGDPLEGGDGAWSVRVYYKPFVSWIWGGAVLMALGGLLAASDRRYRLKSTAARAGSKLAAQGAAS